MVIGGAGREIQKLLGDSRKLSGIVSVVCDVCRVTSEQARKGEEQSSLWSFAGSLREALTQS